MNKAASTLASRKTDRLRKQLVEARKQVTAIGDQLLQAVNPTKEERDEATMMLGLQLLDEGADYLIEGPTWSGLVAEKVLEHRAESNE